MLRALWRGLHRYREMALVVAFLGMASYELFEFWVLELPGGPRVGLAFLVHSLQVVLILAATWAVLRAWQDRAIREQALAAMVGKVVGAQEEERRRLAYEIHDGLAQLIVSAKQHIDTCGDLLSADAERAARELAKGVDRLQRAIRETRRVVLALRPVPLDAVDLSDAARDLLREAASEGGWSVRFRENLNGRRLPAAVESAALRILQEALANALRHAKTSSVTVFLHHDADWLGLDVHDEGVGFDAIATGSGRGLGLQSMRERARLLGGSCVVESAPKRGCRISVRLPAPAR